MCKSGCLFFNLEILTNLHYTGGEKEVKSSKEWICLLLFISIYSVLIFIILFPFYFYSSQELKCGMLFIEYYILHIQLG